MNREELPAGASDPGAAGEEWRNDSAGLVESEAVDGPDDALKAESLRQLSAVWPALLDAIEPLLAEMREEQERSP